MITQCCIHELYLQGRSQQPVVDLAKTFERRKCNHREPIPGEDCVASVVGTLSSLLPAILSSYHDAGETNKHRYVIATQSQPLRVRLRTIPAVPLVHINRAVMVLEPPSDATIRRKEVVSPYVYSCSLLCLKKNTLDRRTRPPCKALRLRSHRYVRYRAC